MTIKTKADRTGDCVLELSGEKIFGTLTQPFEKRGSDGSRLPPYWTPSLKFRNRQACSLMQKHNLFLQ